MSNESRQTAKETNTQMSSTNELSELFKAGVIENCEPIFKNKENFEAYRDSVNTTLNRINLLLKNAGINMVFLCSKIDRNSSNLRDEFVIFQTDASQKIKSPENETLISIQLDEQKGDLYMREGKQNLNNPATKADCIGRINTVDVEQQINTKIVTILLAKLSIPDQMHVYETSLRPSPENG